MVVTDIKSGKLMKTSSEGHALSLLDLLATEWKI